MTEIYIGKTVEEAKALACKEFKVDMSKINFEVLEEPKKGFFGKIKGEARVKAEYNPSKAEIARDYILRILSKMGISAEAEIQENDDGATINFTGEETGSIIGRRGETLDALQYLVATICNRGEKDYYRIIIDSCGYREKRKKTLEELTAKISKAVLKNGRSVTLEPMNPFERRIIHATVSEIEGVTSKSIGEEPYRKVIISSKNKKFERPKRDNRDTRDFRNRDRDRDYKPKAKPLDLKTSFEKNYKKPKPEDNINAGLYGKIEF